MVVLYFQVLFLFSKIGGLTHSLVAGHLFYFPGAMLTPWDRKEMTRDA